MNNQINEEILSFLKEHSNSKINLIENWNNSKNKKEIENIITIGKKSKENNNTDKKIRSKSAFSYFYEENKIKIKEEKPNIQGKEIQEILRKEWQQIKEDETNEIYQKYIKLANENKLNKKDTNIDTNIKKKKMSTYIYFCNKNRSIIKQENPGYNSNQIMIMLGSLWNEMKKNNPEQIKQYENIINGECVESEATTEVAIATPINKEKKVIQKKKAVKKEKEIEKEIEKKTIKKITGYNIFSKEIETTIKEDNENMTETEFNKETMKRWKELGKEEQKTYNDRVN
jgi:hypothetical protein